MIQAQYLSDPVTLTNGESTQLLCDENGKLLVSSSGGGGGGTGDASAAKQDEQTAILTDIESKTPALGTNEMANAVPVTIATDDQMVGDISIVKSLVDAILTNLPLLSNQVSMTNNLASLLGRTPSYAQQFKNLGSNATLNISGNSGYLHSFRCRNLSASVRYLQFWDTTGVAGTGTLLEEFVITGNSELIVGYNYFTPLGLFFSTGLAFGFSTTPSTYTAGTASEQITFVRYH